MKKVLVAVLAVALMATAADAATLALKWNADPGSQTLAVAPGAMAQVDVIIDNSQALQPTNISTVFFKFASNPGDNLYMDHTLIVPRAGWNGGGQTGLLGGLAQLLGADIVVGSFMVRNDNAVGDDSAKNIFSDAYVDGGVLNPAGDALLWDSRYNTSYSSYIAFADWGSPYWEPDGMPTGQAANPLILVNAVPEPASLALLALGGFALLRRR